MPDSNEQAIYRVALEALPVAVYVVDRERKITLWSAGAEALTARLRQDVLGVPGRAPGMRRAGLGQSGGTAEKVGVKDGTLLVGRYASCHRFRGWHGCA